MLIQVEGRNKFVGQVGQLRGSKSVRITRICHDVAGEQAVKPCAAAGANDVRLGQRQLC